MAELNEIPIDNCGSEKWTEITLLPEWEEPYYLVYTAKKFGKWVMLKTLKPEYASLPEYQAMIEKEFDVRYDLAHPHIVMINDFEEVEPLGKCIITDDVYGDSLRKLINENKVTPEIIDKLKHDLVSAIDYIQSKHIAHHPITPENIIFTENVGNLKLLDVGFDKMMHMEPSDVEEDIYNYGKVLEEALSHMENKYPNLNKVVQHCTNPNPKKRYHDVQDLHMALEHRNSNHLYILIIIFLAGMVILLAWLNYKNRNKPFTGKEISVTEVCQPEHSFKIQDLCQLK